MDGDDIAVLDPKVVADDTVQTGAAIIKIIVGKNDEDCVLSLLAPNENCVAAEELERLHCVVGKGDNRVVIVDGVGDPVLVSRLLCHFKASQTYISWFGFFFFLRMAVAVSSSSLRSAPEASLDSKVSPKFNSGRCARPQINQPARGAEAATYAKLTFFLWSW